MVVNALSEELWRQGEDEEVKRDKPAPKLPTNRTPKSKLNVQQDKRASYDAKISRIKGTVLGTSAYSKRNITVANPSKRS